MSGSEIAFATPNDVMTHVPWSGDTPRSPAMAGSDTFAIDVSSTFMKVASDSATVPSASVRPESGAGSPAEPAGVDDAGCADADDAAGPPSEAAGIVVQAAAAPALQRNPCVDLPARQCAPPRASVGTVECASFVVGVCAVAGVAAA